MSQNESPDERDMEDLIPGMREVLEMQRQLISELLGHVAPKHRVSVAMIFATGAVTQAAAVLARETETPEQRATFESLDRNMKAVLKFVTQVQSNNSREIFNDSLEVLKAKESVKTGGVH